jgi:hypothetical protein
MDKELERAYDALMQADAAGNKEDAQQIADYIRTLESQQGVPGGKTSVSQVSDADLINVLNPTIGGAIAGEVVGPLVNKGVEAVQANKAPTTTAPAARAAGTPFNPRGVTIEQSVQNWENYGQAQNEAAKRVRREAELHKKYPGFTRAQPPAPPAPPASAMSQLRQAIPGPIKAAGQFLGGAAQSGVVPWLGRAVAGGAAGYQGADAYNRFKQGDMIGGGLSTIGTLGAGASFFPHPAARYGGAAISAGAEGLNQYLDYLKRKSQQPAAAQPQQEQQMPVPMKSGGLVHLAEGGGKLGAAKSVVKKLSDVLIPREGQTIAGTMADRTKATGGFSGGPGFINMHPEYTWAMDSPGAANRLLNVVKNAGGADRVAVAPMLMSTSAHRSNRPVFEKMYLELMEDVKSGKVTPEQIAALNKRLSVEKTLPGAPDITSKDFLDYANAFKRRGTIADIMGQKRIGALDLQKNLDETIDPALREAELGAIGPQLFSAESQILKPGVHPGYKNLILGQKGEDQFTPVPREFLFRDLEAKAMKELGRPLSDYNYRQSVGIPTQVIDEKLLRSLQTLGYKKGGSTTPAWQRSEGKSPSGGLNALGRASYKRETGGELKAPQPEGGSRKKSFCARMGGMKKKLTSSETANDPDSRINKALRKWKC